MIEIAILFWKISSWWTKSYNSVEFHVYSVKLTNIFGSFTVQLNTNSDINKIISKSFYFSSILDNFWVFLTIFCLICPGVTKNKKFIFKCSGNDFWRLTGKLKKNLINFSDFKGEVGSLNFVLKKRQMVLTCLFQL